MNKFKKALALLSAFLIMTAAFSCGQTEEDIASSDEPVGVTSDIETSEKDDSEASDDEASEEDSSASSSDKKDSDTDDSSESSKEDSSAADNKTDESSEPSEETSKPSSGGNSSTGGSSSSGGNTSSGGSSSSGGNTSSGGNSSSGNTSSGGNSSTGGSSSSSGNASSGNTSTGSTSDTPAEEEVAYTAEITLGSTSKATGSNVTVDGANVLITAGGEYYLKGTISEGQLQVKTTEKVKLHLDGVNITCSTGPAILIEDAKRLTIRLMEGTTNTLTDSGKNKAYDGVIFSNDTVEIRGKGTLNINAGNAHGIASDDDVVIENGNINITSVKSGIHVNDDITINGGTVNIKGGTNGLKSKGTIHVNGGTSVISGGTKEEKSSIYSAGIFTYTGGYLFAAGNLVTAPASPATPYAIAGFSSSQAASTSVTLYANGSQAVSFAPHSLFKCVMMLSPELTAGSKFSAEIGGKKYGEYTISDDSSQNIFTLE